MRERETSLRNRRGFEKNKIKKRANERVKGSPEAPVALLSLGDGPML